MRVKSEEIRIVEGVDLEWWPCGYHAGPRMKVSNRMELLCPSKLAQISKYCQVQ